MIRTIFTAMVFFTAAAFPQSITLISPNGGETYTSGQPVMIRWKSENSGVYVWLEYSVDSGKRWRSISPRMWAAADSQIWTPMVKKRVDNALLRISADTTALSPRDSSDSSFVILPLPAGDNYEPNDDFSSAYPISLGDSTVKNAFVFGVDSLEPDSTFFDADFYKVTLEAGKLLTVCMIPWATDRFGNDQRFEFALFDSSKSLLYSDYYFQNLRPFCTTPYNVTKTGTYYIKIRNIYYIGYGTPYHYGLSVLQSNYTGHIALVSPTGGETFNPEDSVTVEYQTDSLPFTYINMEYSIDSGKSWRDASEYTPSASRLWSVPHLKRMTDRALIRVYPVNIANPPYGVSNGTFTISASPNDAYEPNDDFASAKAIECGDSVVKNAIVMTSTRSWDPDSIDTLFEDVDFFKVNLTAGNVVTIHNDWGHNWDDPDVLIRLYDASKNQIEAGGNYITSYISQSGIYYIEVVYGCKYDYWIKYCLSIHQASGAITLISPNGGEILKTGQTATISWMADSSAGSINVSYSRDNGTSWEQLGYSFSVGNQSFSWEVPALRARTDQALVKVTRTGVANPPSDVSNGPFTIQAAPVDDPYEPNNDMPSAYPIAIGDSMVNNALTYRFADVPKDSSGSIDYDFFKVNLTAGSLVGIRSWVSEGKTVNCDLSDASQNILREIRASGYYNTIPESGVYYIRIGPNGLGDWVRYGLSIRSMKTLITQYSRLDSAAMHYDSSSNAYQVQLAADTTKLTVDLKLYRKDLGSITTMALAPNDCAPLPNEKAKVRAVAIIPGLEPQWVKSMDIALPYALSDLNGYPEKALAAAWENWESGKWDSIPSSIDTVKHQIVIHTTCFSYVNLFQVYVKSNTGIGPISAPNPPVFGIRTNFLNQKQSIAVHFSLPTAADACLQLYNIQGKCIRRAKFAAGPGASTLRWNLGALSNGKYILTVKAGRYHAQETMLIIH